MIRRYLLAAASAPPRRNILRDAAVPACRRLLRGILPRPPSRPGPDARASPAVRRWASSSGTAASCDAAASSSSASTDAAAAGLVSLSLRLEEIGPPGSAAAAAHSAVVAGKMSEGARRELVAAIGVHGGVGAAATASEPARRQLVLTALNQGVPFIGFGIMDNAIMIMAGGAIDAYLGSILLISTMCAAAIGNIISDVAGVMCGTVIEDLAAKFGLRWETNLSRAQMGLRSVRFASQIGMAVGITVGCIIGMVPLLYIDSEKVERSKKEAVVDGIFRDIVDEAKSLVGAEWTTLFLVVPTGSDATEPSDGTNKNKKADSYELWAKYADEASGTTQELRLPYGQGIIGRVAMAGETMNIYDARTEPDFENTVGEAFRKNETRSMICCPVFDSEGGVIAVISATNKMDRGSSKASSSSSAGTGPVSYEARAFSANDVQVLQALATHVSVALRSLENSEEDARVSLATTIRILKEHGAGALQSNERAIYRSTYKRRPLYTLE